MYLLLAFVLVPIIEIALFIQVGGAIGMWPTLGIVVLTAVLGTWLVRTQGRIALNNLSRSFSELNDPTEPLAHGAMILVAGVLLLTPGFFTDIVGLSLLVPGVRRAAYRWLRSRMSIKSFSTGAQPPHQPRDRVIDGEFEDVTPDKKPTHRPSGWTQH